MEPVIITLYIKDKEHSYDLELPADVKVKILIQLIINALKLEGQNYTLLKDKATGEILDENTTLGENGLWSGSILEL